MRRPWLVGLAVVMVVGGFAALQAGQAVSQLQLTVPPMPPAVGNPISTVTPFGTPFEVPMTATLIPGFQQIIITSVPGATLPNNLLPPFTPSVPCELQNVNVYVQDACYSQRVSERTLLTSNPLSLLTHEDYIGSGCMGSINTRLFSLQRCDRISGEREILAQSLGDFSLYPSPDGQYQAFSSFNWKQPDNVPDSTIYRVNTDGSNLLILNPEGMSEPYLTGIVVQGWLDSEWVLVHLWDGTSNPWQMFAFKADGSGAYETLGPVGSPLPVTVP